MASLPPAPDLSIALKKEMVDTYELVTRLPAGKLFHVGAWAIDAARIHGALLWFGANRFAMVLDGSAHLRSGVPCMSVAWLGSDSLEPFVMSRSELEAQQPYTMLDFAPGGRRLVGSFLGLAAAQCTDAQVCVRQPILNPPAPSRAGIAPG